MTDETTEDAIFTKEDFAAYNGFISGLLRESEQDVVEWLESKTTDPANLDAFADWVNIRKTGPFRLQHKTLIVTTVKEEVMKLFDIKQNLHSAFAGLPLPEISLTGTIPIIGQINFTVKNLGFLKASINVEIPFLEWQIGFASPQQIIINWEAEIEAMILIKQAYLHSILETPIIEF